MTSQASKSVIGKLAKCQQILGYNFRNTSLLEESLTIGKNKRLATAGDTYVQVALVDRWFSVAKNTSSDFNTIRTETLSNNSLAQVGFRRGLDACTLPSPLSPFANHHAMADTVEALIGAVYRDALFENGERKAVGWDAFEGVIARLGINHRLIASTSDLRWALNPMKTTRTLVRQFFSGGHHLELAKLIAETNSKLPSVRPTAADDSSCKVLSSSPKSALTRSQKGKFARGKVSGAQRQEVARTSTKDQEKSRRNRSKPKVQAWKTQRQYQADKAKKRHSALLKRQRRLERQLEQVPSKASDTSRTGKHKV